MLPLPDTLPLPDDDSATLITPGAIPGTWSGVEEWALIRYVGQPFGEVIWLREENLCIGRAADNTVALLEPEVSRRHARIQMAVPPGQTAAVHLWDLGSTNGTYVNGRRLEENLSVHLKEGDVLRVGGHAFKLRSLDPLEQAYHEAVQAQTSIDPLTGVSNRTTVLAFLEKHAELARRHRRPLSLILVDLDHFKQVNDRFGHPVGDLVLQAFGRLVASRLRGSDCAGRIGGEEFLVVLPETQGVEATHLAEDLRLALQDHSSGDLPRATCSLGLTQLREGDGNGGALLARADVALYRAKSMGRNRVECDLP